MIKIGQIVDDQRCQDVLKFFNERATLISDKDFIEFSTDTEDALSVDSTDGSINNLVLFDDVMLDRTANPARIFSRGRHIKY